MTMNRTKTKSITTLLMLLWGGMVLISQPANPFDIKPSKAKQDTLKTIIHQSTPATSTSAIDALSTPAGQPSKQDTFKPRVDEATVTRNQSSTAVVPDPQNPFELRSPAIRPAGHAGSSAGIITPTNQPVDAKKTAAEPADGLKSRSISSPDSEASPTKDSARHRALGFSPDKPEVKKEEVESKFQNILSNYIFWILFLCLVLITFIVNINRSLIPEIYRSLTSDNQFRVVFREFSKGFSNVLYYLLYFIFLVQGALFFYLLQQHFLPVDRQLSYLWFLLGLLLIYGLKHVVLFVLHLLFPVDKEATQYSFILMQFNICIGIVFFCINWVLAFTPGDISRMAGILGLGLFVILYFVRQFRGLLVSARILVSNKFHFFLYLCVVDLLPVLIAGKYLINQSVN